MKKIKLTSRLITSALVVGSIGTAMANGFTDNMGFSGTIASAPAPQWSWKLNPAAVNENKALDVSVVDATLTGGNYEWTITPAEPLYLAGTIDKAFERSDEFVTSVPEISFGGVVLTVADKSVTIVADGNHGQKGSVVLQAGLMLQSIMSSNSNGVITSTKESVYGDTGATVSKALLNSSLVGEYATNSLQKFPWTVLSPTVSNTPYDSTVDGFWQRGTEFIDGLMVVGDRGAFTSDLFAGANSLKLSFPQASIPKSWTATLPITVTMK